MNELPDRVFPLPFIWRGKRLFSVRLRVAVREAALAAMRRDVDAADVTAADVAAARQSVRPSLDAAQVAHLQAYADGR